MFHMKKKRYGPLYVEAHFKGIPWESKDHQKNRELHQRLFFKVWESESSKIGDYDFNSRLDFQI